MSLSMLSTVFTNSHQSGTARLFGLGNSDRYNRVTSATMASFGIKNNLSSATVYASSSVDATLILFGPLFGFFDMGNFNGEFLQITNRRGAASALDVDRFSDYSFNDRARSMLLVGANRGTEFRLSFRDLFLNQWKTMLDAELAGSQAKRKGDPTLTWEMWPSGISYLDPNRRYLKVHQRLRIEIDWWPDYDASITYHIYLYLDGGGHLRGYVARWAYWVEGGVKSGKIADKLKPKVISGMGTLNSALGDQLDGLSGFTLSALYYLPGRQLSRAPTGVLRGTTLDDVTIVVQL